MKEKFLPKLKNKFKNLGFGSNAFEGVADYLATTHPDIEDSEIDNVISGVETLLMAFQADTDRRVGTLKTENERLKKGTKPGGEDNPDATQVIEPVTGNTEFDKLTKLIGGLAQTVQGLVEKDSKQTLQQKWQSAATEKGIKNQKLIEKWMPVSEDKFEEALGDLETFHTDFAVSKANDQSTGRPPEANSGGASGSKKGAAILDAWAKQSQPLGSPVDKTSKE